MKATPHLPRILDRLEKHYGKQKPHTPAGAYEMVLYANCGYPANDATCGKGFSALKAQVGLAPERILAAPDSTLTSILRLGGIFPELRAQRLKEIVARVNDKFGGGLDAVLQRTPAEAKQALKQFPTIGDPGAEKVLLFTGAAPVAAVPSNCVHVLLRLGLGTAYKIYTKDYRSAQAALASALPESCDARMRAYLLLQAHGQQLCKRSRPNCDECPVTKDCRHFQATR